MVQVIQRRAEQTLAQKQARLHIVEGFLLAVDDLDRVVKAIRSAADVKAARGALQAGWELSEVQADAVLNISLRRLTGLAIDELKGEQKELTNRIGQLHTLLGDPVRLQAVWSAYCCHGACAGPMGGLQRHVSSR